MDPDCSLQDVIRCDLCDTPLPPLYCETCHNNLCKACAGEHLLDESKFHIVVVTKHRQPIPKCSYPVCTEHTTKQCELYCEQCDTSVCVQCVFSKRHNEHNVIDILKFMESRNKLLQADLEELGKFIYPMYQEIASSFLAQKTDLRRNTERLMEDLDKRGQDWHRKIDNIVTQFKSDIDKAESRHLTVLKKEEGEINHTISKITQRIGELKKLKDSSDVCLLSKYKSNNAEFRKLPPKLIVSLPSFSSQRIDTEQLFQQFGSLSLLSITTEERLYTMKYCETNSRQSDFQPLELLDSLLSASIRALGKISLDGKMLSEESPHVLFSERLFIGDFYLPCFGFFLPTSMIMQDD